MSERPRSPVKVVAAGEKKPLALVPSSVRQARVLAEQYSDRQPGAVLIIKRGEKVVGHVEPADTDAA